MVEEQTLQQEVEQEVVEEQTLQQEVEQEVQIGGVQVQEQLDLHVFNQLEEIHHQDQQDLITHH